MRDPYTCAHLRALRRAHRRPRAGEGRPDVLLRSLRRAGGRDGTSRPRLRHVSRAGLAPDLTVRKHKTNQRRSVLPRRQGLAPVPAGALMISAPDASFGSAARAAAASGVRDSAGAGVAGCRADSFCFGSDASGLLGAILSSDGEISFKDCDDDGFIDVGVSAANAGKAQLAMTNPTANDCTICTMRMLLFIPRTPTLFDTNSSRARSPK